MYKNGLSYGKCTAIVLITHIVMLTAILLRGKYENPQQIIPLAVAVIGLDIVYCTVLKLFYKQMTYTLDFMLILLLNISVIFQSCFGSIGFRSSTISLVSLHLSHASSDFFSRGITCGFNQKRLHFTLS